MESRAFSGNVHAGQIPLHQMYNQRKNLPIIFTSSEVISDWFPFVSGHRGEERFDGQQDITTDDSGKAFAVIDLNALKEAPTLGSTLRIDVQWVGPTRELIEESASVE